MCQTIELNKVDELLISSDVAFEEVQSNGSIEKYFSYEKTFTAILNCVSLSDYFQAVYSFSSEHIHSEKTFLSTVLEAKLPIFFKNKILRSPMIAESTKISETDVSEFSNVLNPYFSFVYKNYRSMYKQIHNKKLKEDMSSIPKICLFPIGFLYCGLTTNRIKLTLLFNLFSEEGLLSRSSEDFFLFLFFLMLYPSNILLLTIDEIAKENSKIRSELSVEKFLGMYDDFKIKDAYDICKQYINQLFGESPNLSYTKFEESILSNKLHWIFFPKGIRFMFESNHKVQTAQ